MFVVNYTGAFGYIKPWTAVRDALTYSQTFLTPSIVEGIRQKLEVSAVMRHKLRHVGVDVQKERTQSAGWATTKAQAARAQSILDRGILLQPVLSLAFPTQIDAESAARQHVCLCRNEDVLLPLSDVVEMTLDEFDRLPGVELVFENGPESFLVGYNRFDNVEPMYGRLSIVEDDAS